MSKRNNDMRNNRNDKNNKPGLAKKVYAIAMSVMMVVSLWPANAGLAVADELAAALNGDGTVAATPAVPLEADSTVEPETKGADEAFAAPGADAGDAADAAAGDEPADAAPAVPSFAEHSDAAAQSSEAQARAVAEQGAAASPTGFVPGQYGNYTYSVNTIKDAFTATGEFSQFRDPQAESTLGVAGDFHITAFNEAANNCHVYGNVLAKTLNGGNNFGLSDKFFNIYNYYGLTYVQKLKNSTGNLDGRTNGTFVVGNDNKFEAVDNGSRLSINGSTRDTPQNFIQDADSASAPFIDIDAVHADSLSRSRSMAAVADVGVSKKIEGNRATLTYSAEKGCAYTSMTASELNGIGDQLIIDGMNSKGQCSMVINVDMQGQSSVTIPCTRLIIDGKQASGGEIDYDTGFVLFNFYNAGLGTTINIGEAVASALAPDANINLTNGNACGTYIGYNVTASAESHARPFHGKLEPVVDGVSVTKQWLDAYGNAEADSAHSKLSVEAQLYQSKDGGEWVAYGDPVELNAANKWTYNWTGLPKKDVDGNSYGSSYEYKVEEVKGFIPAGYSQEGDAVRKGDTWVLTNRRDAVGKLSVSKAWDDSDDADQIRPDSVTVELVRQAPGADDEVVDTKELNASNNWSAFWDQLQLTNASGNACTYTVRERAVDGYTPKVDPPSAQTDGYGNKSWSYQVTNSHALFEKTSVSVNKHWLNSNGTAETGEHGPVKVQLYKTVDGQTSPVEGKVAELSEDNAWSASFDGLAKKTLDGKEISYSVAEVEVPAGYEASTSHDGDSWTVTNTREATLSVKGQKVWDDVNDLDRLRPDSATLTLVRSVNGEIDPSFSKDYELSESNGWSFSESGLPAKDADGNAYTYSVLEKNVPDGYEEPSIASECATDAAGNVSYSFKVTNTHRVESHKTNVMVNKSWLNAVGNPDEGEHPAVKAQLYKRHVEGGSIVEEPVDGPVELSAANNWSYTWADQVERDEDGVTYTYDVREVECPDGFAPEATTSADNSFTLVNKREATVSVAAQKSWADDGDADGVRPDSVTIRVKRSVAGGQPEDTGTVLTLVEDNGWHAEADGLPAADADGNAYEYQLVEDPIGGYEGTAKTSESVDPSTGVKTFSVELTNRHERQKTKVVVSKAWDDEDNQDGIRPQKVTVALKRTVEGTEATEDVRQIELNGQNGWKAEVDDLPVAGVIDGRKGKFAYTVEEARVDGYEGKVELAKQADGSYAFAVTNRHEAAKTSVNVRKVWDDGDDIDRLRPESVKAQLCVKQADGQVVPVEGVDPVILNEDNNWSAGWTDLDARKDGEDIQYTVQEVEVPDGYEVEVSDGVSDDDGASYTYTMTNKHQTEGCDFSLTGYSVASVNDILQPDDECYVDPKIVKRLDGRALEAGEFKFQLVDEKTGEAVSIASNDESGMVDFDKAANVAPDGMDASCLKFTKEGTYSYIVKEVSESKDPSIDYSNEVVKFVVQVTRDSAGNLTSDKGRLVADGGTYYYYENAGSTLSKELPPDEHPTITNSVEPISLGLRKTDADGTKDLSGATYGLYKAEDNAKVAEAVSGEDGTMVFTSADMPISEGVKYYFLEISAPDGYLLDKTPTSAFTIGHSGTGSSIEYHATFDDGHVSESATFGQTIAIDCGTVTDKAFGIVLSKVDADGKGIKGAKLEVREATGSKAIDSWESDGAGHVLSGVQPGVKYVFHEASAPSGYAQASDVEFTVDASGKVSIVSGGKATVSGKGVVNAYAGDASLTMIDYKKDEKVDHKTTERSEPRTTTKDRSIPQTGDTSASPLWLVVAAIVVTVAGFYFWRKSR